MGNVIAVSKEEQKYLDEFRRFRKPDEIFVKLIDCNGVGLEGERTCYYLTFCDVIGSGTTKKDEKKVEGDWVFYDATFVGNNSEMDDIYKDVVLFLGADDDDDKKFELLDKMLNVLPSQWHEHKDLDWRSYLGKYYVITIDENNLAKTAVSIEGYIDSHYAEKLEK